MTQQRLNWEGESCLGQPPPLGEMRERPSSHCDPTTRPGAECFPRPALLPSSPSYTCSLGEKKPFPPFLLWQRWSSPAGLAEPLSHPSSPGLPRPDVTARRPSAPTLGISSSLLPCSRHTLLCSRHPPPPCSRHTVPVLAKLLRSLFCLPGCPGQMPPEQVILPVIAWHILMTPNQGVLLTYPQPSGCFGVCSPKHQGQNSTFLHLPFLLHPLTQIHSTLYQRLYRREKDF